ncbi:hypothetical protein ACFOHW_04060 [Paenibacillus abyssi]
MNWTGCHTLGNILLALPSASCRVSRIHLVGAKVTYGTGTDIHPTC